MSTLRKLRRKKWNKSKQQEYSRYLARHGCAKVVEGNLEPCVPGKFSDHGAPGAPASMGMEEDEK